MKYEPQIAGIFWSFQFFFYRGQQPTLTQRSFWVSPSFHSFHARRLIASIPAVRRRAFASQFTVVCVGWRDAHRDAHVFDTVEESTRGEPRTGRRTCKVHLEKPGLSANLQTPCSAVQTTVKTQYKKNPCI